MFAQELHAAPRIGADLAAHGRAAGRGAGMEDDQGRHARRRKTGPHRAQGEIRFFAGLVRRAAAHAQTLVKAAHGRADRRAVELDEAGAAGEQTPGRQRHRRIARGHVAGVEGDRAAHEHAELRMASERLQHARHHLRRVHAIVVRNGETVAGNAAEGGIARTRKAGVRRGKGPEAERGKPGAHGGHGGFGHLRRVHEDDLEIPAGLVRETEEKTLGLPEAVHRDYDDGEHASSRPADAGSGAAPVAAAPELFRAAASARLRL